MATAKPDDKKEPARVPRSGHGSASLIPHLTNNSALVRPDAADAAAAQEAGNAQAQADPGGQPPQAQ